MRSNVLVALLPGLLSLSAAVDVKDFDWEAITPSYNLTYTPCYGELQCARLIVPLDWQDETNPHTVALAITKLPAKVPEDDPTFGGTIFTNPGGPGGSGVDLILSQGHNLQNISGGSKNYEILSWDPRGVGFTTPKADCFQGDNAARGLANFQTLVIGPLDSSDYTLKRQWARTQAFGRLCEGSAKNGSILPYLTTPSVVRDMVEMLDQIHVARGHGAQVVYASEDGAEKMLNLKKRKDEVPRIQYWGFSYGSILGNTFASMYPGRVGRLIIDGIADADDYMKGTWLNNLQDTEAIVDHFYKSCFEAGNACSLKKPSDIKWQDVKQRVDAFIAQTNEEPISIIKNNKIVLITGTELLSAFTMAVFSPLKTFKRLADLLSGTLESNYTLLLADLGYSTPQLHDNRALLNSSTFGGKDATRAIKCGDGEDETHHDLSYFKSYLEELKSQSPTLGADFATTRFACSGWTIRPKWRFTGPFTTPKHDSTLVEGKPAAPLLILSSRLDPVTPLHNAVNMAAKHPGAAYVVQESTGHCATSVPSKCTKKIVQDYLEHGTVPKSGTVCQADCDPWNPCEQEDQSMMIGMIGLCDETGSLIRHNRLTI
ncbi:putative TAP-like protein-domain-containing protein [Seiridium cardinale]|uniref:TAP-like protein-domain-containing protein n=1 Tax=Seiridium cardinale TaxID=138064 RepID=A0ABR2XRT2_9PEZI